MLTPLSPQSQSVIEALLAGKAVGTGKSKIGPLDAPSRTLLQLLVEETESLSKSKGEEQARKLRHLFKATKDDSTACTAAIPKDVSSTAPAPTPSFQWRLNTLNCCSIRGIAPAGELFQFEFHDESNLIYGPNGSGKSSLLGAIVWILTGVFPLDSSATETSAPVYKSTDDNSVGPKVRDWPIAATLPTVIDTLHAAHDYWAELVLKSECSGQLIKLRRSSSSGLAHSVDGITWTATHDISVLGITPLDLQLSVIAPTVFGRRALDEAENARDILSMMLGYDDLEAIGQLASAIGRNRTVLVNKEKQAVDGLLSRLKDRFRDAGQLLMENSAEQLTAIGLYGQTSVSLASITAFKATLKKSAEAAESHLAELLGLPLTDGRPPTGLADKLTVAVSQLSKGISENFPSLNQTRLAVVLPPTPNATAESQLAAITSALASWRDSAVESIQRRYAWWRKETAHGSRASLLLKASQFFDPNNPDCPVCERSLVSTALIDELESLKSADATLHKEVDSFFGALLDALKEIVPERVRSLSRETISSRIKRDWSKLSGETLGDVFASLTDPLQPRMEMIAANAAPATIPVRELLSEDCDPSFGAHASKLLDVSTQINTALSMIYWSDAHIEPLFEELDKIVTSSESDSSSLLLRLNQGKVAANGVTPLLAAIKTVGLAERECRDIEAMLSEIATLAQLVDPIDALKQLSKFAADEVTKEFESIKVGTSANLAQLYPIGSTGLRPGRLNVGSGRKKTVEPLLTADGFEVPGQFFANAGLQRAIALAFYFALLEKHPKRLECIVMDDPILSLDDEHRERWSSHLLAPVLQSFQVILATHQCHFLRNCRADFEPGRVVELNHRNHRRRISWKPGDRVLRAEYLIEAQSHFAAALELRKFREDVLISLDAYSPSPFFDQSNLAQSFQDYEKFVDPHPLARGHHDKICKGFRSNDISRVLDPSAHAMTESQVTNAMVEMCLARAKDISGAVRRELERLEQLRLRDLRATAIVVASRPFPSISAQVSWATQITIRQIGAAAAQSHGWTVDMVSEPEMISIQPAGAVQVVGNTLEPVASHGQWVLLANEAERPEDGDLVAAIDLDDQKYLRRAWSSERDWVLQSVNPVVPMACITLSKQSASLRKVLGVVYSPPGSAVAKSAAICEWIQCLSFDPARFANNLLAVEVRGDSLDPIAREGQRVLVEAKLSSPSECIDGQIAVVDTGDSGSGLVIKRAYPGKSQWILVSPNPVDPYPPLSVSVKEVRAVWPVCGVLFESLRIESES